MKFIDHRSWLCYASTFYSSMHQTVSVFLCNMLARSHKASAMWSVTKGCSKLWISFIITNSGSAAIDDICGSDLLAWECIPLAQWRLWVNCKENIQPVILSNKLFKRMPFLPGWKTSTWAGLNLFLLISKSKCIACLKNKSSTLLVLWSYLEEI